MEVGGAGQGGESDRGGVCRWVAMGMMEEGRSGTEIEVRDVVDDSRDCRLSPKGNVDRRHGGGEM
jgi:hypothetical protein